MNRLWNELKNSGHWTDNALTWVAICSFLINLLGLALPLTFLQVYDRIIPNNSKDTLAILILFVCVSILLENIIKHTRNTFIEASQTNYLGYQINQSIYEDAYELAQRIKNTTLLENNQFQSQTVITIIDMTFSITFLFIISSIHLALTLPSLASISIIFMKFRYKKNLLEYSSLKEGILKKNKDKFVKEIIKKILSIKTMSKENHMLRKYENKHFKYIKQKRITTSAKNKIKTHMDCLLTFNLTSVLCLGSYLIINNKLSLGALAATIILSSKIIQPFNRLINIWSNEYSLEKHINRRKNKKQRIKCVKVPKGDISIRGLTISNREVKIESLDIDIPENSITCILEPSKISHILLSIVQRTENIACTIKINNTIYENSFEEPEFSIIKTNSVFNATLKENINLFSDDKQLTKRSIDLFYQLCPTNLLSLLSKGLDTYIDSSKNINNDLISAIILTRAIFRKPEVIFIDDCYLGISKTLLNKFIKICSEMNLTVVIFTNIKSKAELGQNIVTLSTTNYKSQMSMENKSHGQ